MCDRIIVLESSNNLTAGVKYALIDILKDGGAVIDAGNGDLFYVAKGNWQEVNESWRTRKIALDSRIASRRAARYSRN